MTNVEQQKTVMDGLDFMVKHEEIAVNNFLAGIIMYMAATYTLEPLAKMAVDEFIKAVQANELPKLVNGIRTQTAFADTMVAALHEPA